MLTPVLVLGGLGLAMGTGLFFALKKFPPKFDPIKDAVEAILPGANCGGCGFPGCSGYASALAASKGKVGTTLCPPGGVDTAKKIQEIFGIEEAIPEPVVAVILCAGTNDAAPMRSTYLGEVDCNIAALTGGGPKACTYGCMGFGSCVRACPFDAIALLNGIAVVLPEKCTGCGKCVEVCPKKIIKLFPKEHQTHILCSSQASGKETKAVCSVGCTACRQCARLDTRIAMDGNLAVIKTEGLQPFASPDAALVCPQKTILDQSAFSTVDWLACERNRYDDKQKEWKEEQKRKKDAEKAKKENETKPQEAKAE